MKADAYGVIGNPIAHTKSPYIHSLFAQKTQQTIEYNAIFSQVEEFEATVSAFFAQGGKGLNVTVPFKPAAYKLVQHASSRAQLAGAVNVITQSSDGSLQGDNVDGLGLIRDLTINKNITIQSQTILVIGAGGSAYGIVGQLLEQQPASLTIATRTAASAQALVKHFAHLGNLHTCELSHLGAQSFDIIINATSASLQNAELPLSVSILKNTSCCYDLAYATQPTPFMQWAHRNGITRYFDGWGMLVEQAAESFLIWRGIRPDTKELLEQRFVT